MPLPQPALHVKCDLEVSRLKQTLLQWLVLILVFTLLPFSPVSEIAGVAFGNRFGYLIFKVLMMLVCAGVSGKLLYQLCISVLYS